MKIKVLAKGAKIGSASFEYEPGYEFISDPACSEYDWLVVYDELHTEGPVSAPRAEGGAGTSRARPSSNGDRPRLLPNGSPNGDNPITMSATTWLHGVNTRERSLVADAAA